MVLFEEGGTCWLVDVSSISPNVQDSEAEADGTVCVWIHLQLILVQEEAAVSFAGHSGMLSAEKVIATDGGIPSYEQCSLTSYFTERHDFVVQSKTLSELVTAFSAHGSYWSSLDCAQFIAQRLRTD